MFKYIIQNKITAEEIKNRILAYASLQAAQENVDEDYWYGNISTYTLNLRLSGIYGEKPFNDVLSSGADTTLNIGKYPYLESEVFVRETQHLDELNFVKQLYQAFLAREADPGGLEGNVNQLKNGALRENLVIGLRNSQEADGVFLRVTDCLDDEHFLEIAHRVYLQPENRPLRLAKDLQSLQNGVTREAVFQDLKQFQQLQTALQHRQGDFYRPDSIFLQNTQTMSNEEFVKELYLTYCKREADPGGLAGNVEQLSSGVARADLLSGLRTSEEAANVFVDLTVGLDNATFIAIAYLAYRKEELTSQKKQQCQEILEAGNIRQTILREELSPPETAIREIDPIVPPIEPEIIAPSPLELALEQLQSNFALEDETFLAQTAHLSHGDFIQQLYLTYLKREADPNGLAGNLQQLNNGVARLEILYELRTSEEAANVFVDLISQVDNGSFIALAYKYYRQQELQESQQARDLQILESGAIRQTILRNCPPLNFSVEEVTETVIPTIESKTPSLSPLEQLLADLKIEDQDFIDGTENLTHSEFIQQVYRTFFRREADLEGLTSHTEQLDRGVSRWEILYDLRTSQEAANIFVETTTELDNSQYLDLAYRVYLKRELNSENKAAYLEYLERGHPRQDILK
jgi:acylphosphatase